MRSFIISAPTKLGVYWVEKKSRGTNGRALQNTGGKLYVRTFFFSTVHHRIDLFHLPTLTHNYFIH